MTPDAQQSLIAAAINARRRAYAPYSNFQVGAALLTADGRTFTGCNVENASYGLTVCAERVALCNAIVGGGKAFVALAVATAGGSSPCGACRQALAEFCDELPILLVDANAVAPHRELNLQDLLPNAFGAAVRGRQPGS
jgi:cytidine deaminase